MSASEASPLAQSSEAGSVFLRAFEQNQHLQERAYHVKFRQMLVTVMNAAIHQKHDATSAIHETGNELALGISYVHARQGMEGVTKFLESAKLPELISIGRQLLKKYLLDPLTHIKERNAVHASGGVFSATVESAYADRAETQVQLVSDAMHEIIRGETCDDFSHLWQCGEKIKSLERALDIAGILSLHEKAVAKENRSVAFQESGLLNLIGGCISRISYLEVAVFSAVFAKRHKQKQDNPFTFPAGSAKKFLTDVDEKFHLLPEAKTAYTELCAARFPEQQREAQVLLERYLESVAEYRVNAQAHMAKTPLSPELFFPVHQYSSAVLKQSGSLRKKQL